METGALAPRLRIVTVGHDPQLAPGGLVHELTPTTQDLAPVQLPVGRLLNDSPGVVRFVGTDDKVILQAFIDTDGVPTVRVNYERFLKNATALPLPAAPPAEAKRTKKRARAPSTGAEGQPPAKRVKSEERREAENRRRRAARAEKKAALAAAAAAAAAVEGGTPTAAAAPAKKNKKKKHQRHRRHHRRSASSGSGSGDDGSLDLDKISAGGSSSSSESSDSDE